MRSEGDIETAGAAEPRMTARRPSRGAFIAEHASEIIASTALLAIAVHLVLRFLLHASAWSNTLPLWIALAFGGGPLVVTLLIRLVHRQFGSDLLAGLAILTAVVSGEYLTGTIVVLMLSGGQAIEAYAVERASSALRALADRMPTTAHRRRDGAIDDVPLEELQVDDIVVMFPHEIAPVDGIVIEGSGTMNEAFVTGEAFLLAKTRGSEVISGAINGDAVLTLRATRRPSDSRYARIMDVMRRAEQERPRMRRLADRLGALYTPIAIAIAVAAWLISGDASRFLAVLVIATPCPLLIGIPVAIIGAVSLCARRGIIVKDPACLEQVCGCKTAIFDKTGTLTYGRPTLVNLVSVGGSSSTSALQLSASLERYSKHPLATAVMRAAQDRNLTLYEVDDVSEPPGHGLRGTIAGHRVEITGRAKLAQRMPASIAVLPSPAGGLECIVLIDDVPAAVLAFRDEPRAEAAKFVDHLRSSHGFRWIVIASGDRAAEVQYVARTMGVDVVRAEQAPEEKVALVRAEAKLRPTMYIGDGINDAPALRAATVGVSVSGRGDIAAEAAGAVVPDGSLQRVDEFLHISHRMRRIALQSAVGGMALSIVGMIAAAYGLLIPIAGAITQEVIDVLAVLNALRAAFPPATLSHLAELAASQPRPNASAAAQPTLPAATVVAAVGGRTLNDTNARGG